MTLICSFKTTNFDKLVNPIFHLQLCVSHKIVNSLGKDDTEYKREPFMIQICLNTFAIIQLNGILDWSFFLFILVIIQQFVCIQNKVTSRPL